MHLPQFTSLTGRKMSAKKGDSHVSFFFSSIIPTYLFFAGSQPSISKQKGTEDIHKSSRREKKAKKQHTNEPLPTDTDIVVLGDNIPGISFCN